MKKLLAITLTILLVLSVFTFSVSAAGTYGEYEQKVIELLADKHTTEIAGEDVDFIIPTAYVNQAKAFFAGTAGDVTKIQYEEIVKFINAGIKKAVDTVEADHSLIKNHAVDFAHFPQKVKADILYNGQQACAVVDLSLVYDGKNVVITDVESGKVVFENKPIVKTTGVDVTSVAVVAAAFAVVIASAFVIVKKSKQF